MANKRLPKKRTPMSMEVDPRLQKRLKICAAKLGISRATLVERLILDGIYEQELQAHCDEHAVARMWDYKE